ncbi:MAG: 3-isopropylmalate dehydratase small subunit [Beijerinckiaceae bacterium]|jgi:3-isopropylmalate/(R)-2-methylmalate dehydratase small subunit|nr:3-isopropylmalate dehydratase small subunit [Beijerinckiaceae bacterium]MDO9442109.1 3-isopropylmalate dehydratase small subunit [Beijerinckiaceae bacterium]
MKPFVSVTGVAVPFVEDDVNTDQIAPIPTRRSLKPDLAEMFFHAARRQADGSLDPSHVLNRPQYAASSIFVTGRNFGCGSSREGAVWTFLAVGITCIVARSIADLYRENCLQNGLLPIELADDRMDGLLARVRQADGREPFTVDLRTRTISGPGGGDIPFDISDADRTRLLEGLDDIGMSLKHEQAIAAWEERTRASAPWLQQPSRDPSRESAP